MKYVCAATDWQGNKTIMDAIPQAQVDQYCLTVSKYIATGYYLVTNDNESNIWS